jgi:YkoY family integral membrane protein
MLDQLLEYTPTFTLDALVLLPVLIALEAILSADNAIALAAIARGLPSPQVQRQALNIGLFVAFGLRIILILTANWVKNYWQFEVLGAAYLLWLAIQYFMSQEADADDAEDHHHRFSHLWEAIPILALTDLAFSLDSVTAAIGISEETWLVILGGAIGVLTLRFMAELFIRWLKIYEHLEDAGYLAVALVGLRLMVRAISPELVPPDWMMIVLVTLLFIWGFSKRSPQVEDEA